MDTIGTNKETIKFPLTNSTKVFVIDKDDLQLVMSLGPWSLHNQGYVMRSFHGVYFLHNLLNPPTNGLENDHIDRDRLNNSRSNLRLVTHQQNTYNQGLKTSNTTGCPNVSWDKEKEMWIVRIRINGEKKFIGRYRDFELACKVSNETMEARNNGSEIIKPKRQKKQKYQSKAVIHLLDFGSPLEKTKIKT